MILPMLSPFWDMTPACFSLMLSKEPEAPMAKKFGLALVNTKDFPGVSGSITIDPDRNARKPIVIIAVSDAKMKYKETIQP